MSERANLPGWPLLMGIELAAAYLGVSATTFRALGVVPLNIGKRVLWDRRSLDIYADQLAGQPIADDDRDRAAREIERNFLERRRRG